MRLKRPLLDNSNDPPVPTWPGLGVELTEAQRRSLRWMLAKEDAGSQDELVVERGCRDCRFSTHRGIDFQLRFSFTLRGGVLADSMGYGKTLLAIGLIAASVSEALPPRGSRLPCSATLVFVPENLVCQWLSEFGKALGGMVETHLFGSGEAGPQTSPSEATLGEAGGVGGMPGLGSNSCEGPGKPGSDGQQHKARVYAAVSVKGWQEMMQEPWPDALALIVPYSLLLTVEPWLTLHRYHWRRIVMDELHEALASQTLADALGLVSAEHVWGLSGTLPTATAGEVVKLATLFGVAIPSDETNAGRFLDCYVRKNTSSMSDTIPVDEHCCVVRPTAMERALYLACRHDFDQPIVVPEVHTNYVPAFLSTWRGLQEHGREAALVKLCCHHQATTTDQELLSTPAQSVARLRVWKRHHCEEARRLIRQHATLAEWMKRGCRRKKEPLALPKSGSQPVSASPLCHESQSQLPQDSLPPRASPQLPPQPSPKSSIPLSPPLSPQPNHPQIPPQQPDLQALQSAEQQQIGSEDVKEEAEEREEAQKKGAEQEEVPEEDDDSLLTFSEPPAGESNLEAWHCAAEDVKWVSGLSSVELSEACERDLQATPFALCECPAEAEARWLEWCSEAGLAPGTRGAISRLRKIMYNELWGRLVDGKEGWQALAKLPGRNWQADYASAQRSRLHEAVADYAASLRSSRFLETTVQQAEAASPGDLECGICLQAVCNPRFTPCAHIFCATCIQRSLSLTTQCPTCRSPFSQCHLSEWNPLDQVFSGTSGSLASASRPVCPSDGAQLALCGSETFSSFGSKIASLVARLQTVQRLGEKAVVFAQWQDLIFKIHSALRCFGIPSAVLAGDAFDRAAVLQRFEGAELPVLLLSLEDSASGTNMAHASHVLLVHPMVACSAEEQRAYEAQAVGRVRRWGQKRRVQVWRFVMEGTVEADYAAQRDLMIAEG